MRILRRLAFAYVVGGLAYALYATWIMHGEPTIQVIKAALLSALIWPLLLAQDLFVWIVCIGLGRGCL